MTRRLLFAAAFLAECLLVFFLLARRSPVSGDDYSYLFQADLFASGRLYAEGPLYHADHPLHGCVLTKCITDHEGRRFSKYPPGWPALLALGTALGAPWLVNPLLGALLIYLLLAHVQRRFGPGLESACGMLLLLNAFLVYYAASYRAHMAAMFCVVSAYLLFEAAEHEPRGAGPRLLGAGALLGATALIRYLDFFPLGLWIGVNLLRRRKARDLLLFAAGFFLLAGGNLLYNQFLSGDPFATPTHLYNPVGIHDHLMLSWRGFLATGARLGTLVCVFPPVLLLLALGRRHPPSPETLRYLALFGMSVAVYFLYPAAVGGPGPRYFLAYFPFIVLAVVDMHRRMRTDDPAGVRRISAVLLGVQVVCSLVFLTLEGQTLHGRRDLERTLARDAGGKRLVLLKTGTYRTAPGDLTRNPADFASADTLIFLWCDQARREALLRLFPGRTVWTYEYPGRLTPYGSPMYPGSADSPAASPTTTSEHPVADR